MCRKPSEKNPQENCLSICNMEKHETKKDFYKRIFFLTFPIVIQNLLDASVNSADVLMLNYVSQQAISACSLATQYSTIVYMLYFGMGAGLTMLAAQYWGKKDIDTIEKIQGIALRYSFIIALIVGIGCIVAPRTMMYVFTDDPVLIAMGADYLRIVGIGMALWSVSTTYMATLRSVGRVAIVTALEASALIINVLLNAVFIFGLFGAPVLGLTGVALATTISRTIQLLLCVLVSVFSKDVKLRIKPVFEKNTVLHKDFVKMAVPAIANDVIWGLAFSTYSAIFGHLGDDVVAANSIVSVVRGFGTVLCYAVGSATGIMLGPVLGRGDIEEAKKESHTFLRLSVLAGAIGGLIVLAITPFAMSVARISDTAKDYLLFMLIVNVVYVMGTAINTTLIVGVFRSGGDSRFGLFCDTIDMWCYAVPLGLLAAFVFKFPVKIVYLLLCTDEFVKWPWVLKNYYSYKWAKNITREVDAE